MTRYCAFDIQFPYAVDVYDGPGLSTLCKHFLGSIEGEAFQIIEEDSYHTEYRFINATMRDSFIAIIENYKNGAYDDLMEELSPN
jgi:hypothetical protein